MRIEQKAPACAGAFCSATRLRSDLFSRTAAAFHELLDSHDDDENRPRYVHEPPGDDVQRSQKEEQAEQDDDDREQLMATAAASAGFPLHFRIFHDFVVGPSPDNISALSPRFLLRLCEKFSPDTPYMPKIFRFASLGDAAKSSESLSGDGPSKNLVFLRPFLYFHYTTPDGIRFDRVTPGQFQGLKIVN